MQMRTCVLAGAHDRAQPLGKKPIAFLPSQEDNLARYALREKASGSRPADCR